MTDQLAIEAMSSSEQAHHRIDELRADLQAIRDSQTAMLQSLARIERGCQLSGERRAASTSGRWAVIAALVTGILALLTACVSLWGCSGPEVQPTATSDVLLDTTVDLGPVTVDIQADATADQAGVECAHAAVSVVALSLLRIVITADYAPGGSQVCVEALGLKRCVDG